MLKTKRESATVLITQPDHGMISGYLAAHWGNDAFATPGHYTDVPDPAQLRAEVVFAIAQHDNGWWEWEASPRIAPEDGLPFGLVDALQDPQEGMQHWRNGMTRFAGRPLVSALICHHAYCLYAVRGTEPIPPDYVHPLYWNQSPDVIGGKPREGEAEFIRELQSLQENWKRELSANASTSRWAEPDTFLPNARLLQLLDAMSLALCSNLVPGKGGTRNGLGGDAFELHHVPRRSWTDRVTIEITPTEDGQILLDPYPFDIDPLPATVPARVFRDTEQDAGDTVADWTGSPLELIRFKYVAG